MSIIIPAAATLTRSTDVQVMQSFGNGSQVYLPPFDPIGLTIVRGGTFKMKEDLCNSGSRIKSGGYGKYHDWGFRVAMAADSDQVGCCESKITINLGGNVSLEMVYIAPGEFVMGGENTVDGRFACVEVPKHPVKLTQGFYIGKYPVTQAQYVAIMGVNPSQSTKDRNCPVDNIGEKDAFQFVKVLADVTGRGFRLPTEAEWEYAARGGSSTKFFWGEDPSLLGNYAWFANNSDMRTHPVGQKLPNPFGLYDVYGNVFERVSDRYDKDYYAKSPRVDPTGPAIGTKSTFEYSINVATAGNYSITADVVTANFYQRLNVMVNGDESSTVVTTLPFTNGYFQISRLVNIPLKAGPNKLRFWRDKPPQHGVAVKKFVIMPV
jgi:formylglycine-generating enzyme required for sulfatase activity